MKKGLLFSLIAMVITLTGCSLGKPVPQPTNYVMVAGSSEQSWPYIGDSLRIDSVRSIAPFNGKEMVYRMDEVQFESDYYHRFISEPDAIVGNQVALWLERSGLYKSVSQPSMRGPSKQVLQIVVTKLFGDFRPGQTPAAVMEMQFVLMETKSVRPEAVLETTLSSRVDIDAQDPKLLAQGLGQAMTNILTQLAGELAKNAAQ